MKNLSIKRRVIRTRSGYMLLVCTLAVTALSMASIAMIRSGQHQIRLNEAQRNSTQSQMTADGLYQRAIATLRANPKAQGTIVDPAIKVPGPRAELKRISKDSTLIQVFLYQRSTVPAISTVIDPEAISGSGGKGKGKGKAKGKTKK